MPKAYIKLTVKFRTFWLYLLLIGIISQLVMGFFTYKILMANPTDCSGIRIVTWCLFFTHVVNFLCCSLALCGLEKMICNQMILTGFLIFDGLILIWA